MEPEVASQPNSTRSFRDFLAWGAVLFVIAIALSFVSAALPPAVKKIGLFAVAYGMLVGAIAGWLARGFQLPAPGRLRAYALLATAILVCEINVTYQAYRHHVKKPRSTPSVDPALLTARRMLAASQEQPDPESQQTARSLREAIEAKELAAGSRPAFSGYLRHRVAALGPRAERFAFAIWAAEVLVGTLAGCWAFRQLGNWTPASPRLS